MNPVVTTYSLHPHAKELDHDLVTVIFDCAYVRVDLAAILDKRNNIYN